MQDEVYDKVRTVVNELVVNQNYFAESDHEKAFESAINNPAFKLLTDNISSLIFIYNIKTGLYEYISENIKAILGYEAKDFQGVDGVNLLYQSIVEEHVPCFVAMAKEIFEYLFQHATPETGKDFKYSTCIKIKNHLNEPEWYLMETSILLTNASGLPIKTIATCTNVNSIKKDTVVFCDIFKKDSTGLFRLVSQSNLSDPQSLNDILTAREYDILRLLRKGYTNAVIAKELFISLHTVQTHRKRIMKKLGCKRIGELINYAHARGIQ